MALVRTRPSWLPLAPAEIVRARQPGTGRIVLCQYNDNRRPDRSLREEGDAWKQGWRAVGFTDALLWDSEKQVMESHVVQGHRVEFEALRTVSRLPIPSIKRARPLCCAFKNVAVLHAMTTIAGEGDYIMWTDAKLPLPPNGSVAHAVARMQGRGPRRDVAHKCRGHPLVDSAWGRTVDWDAPQPAPFDA
eukprot:2015276-Prymnesium_polylepis.1